MVITFKHLELDAVILLVQTISYCTFSYMISIPSLLVVQPLLFHVLLSHKSGTLTHLFLLKYYFIQSCANVLSISNFFIFYNKLKISAAIY